MSIKQILDYSTKYLLEVTHSRDKTIMSELKIFLPKEIIALLDIDGFMSQINEEASRFDQQEKERIIELKIDGLPSIFIKGYFENGHWKMSASNYVWISKIKDISGVTQINEVHSYRKEDFMLALGEAVQFAKKLGTYKE